MSNSVLETQEDHFREGFQLAGGLEGNARAMMDYGKSLPNKF